MCTITCSQECFINLFAFSTSWIGDKIDELLVCVSILSIYMCMVANENSDVPFCHCFVFH